MEKVVSRKNLKKNTFNINKGDKISLEFLEEMLHEYNFVRTDFVYETGTITLSEEVLQMFFRIQPTFLIESIFLEKRLKQSDHLTLMISCR